MLKQALGKLYKVDLREMWGHEALDFTKWLFNPENLELLSQEIGIAINPIQDEAKVGKFKLDILAEEEGTGRKIIIENQLEMTNHEHLGKLLTYASGHEAGIIVWLVGDAREEHQRAIEWLNERTDEQTAFFLMKIELWRIGESDAAVKFQTLSRPNGWAKAFKSHPESEELRELELQQREFWTAFKAFALEQDPQMRLQTPRPQNWYVVSMGSADAHVSLTVNSQNSTIGCELTIDKNRPLYNYLENHKDTIEEELKEKCIWHLAAVASKVKIARQVPVLFDLEGTAQFSWLYEKTKSFQSVFTKYVKQFKVLGQVEAPFVPDPGANLG